MAAISLIVPVYKAEKYLCQCLDSIKSQTETDWEAILVDDGSPDGSGAICDRYVAQDVRFCVIHQQNTGVAGARKNGFAKATGEFVTFVDADDWLEPECLQKMLSALTDGKADVAIIDKRDFDVEAFDEGNNFYKSGFYDRYRLRREIYPSFLADYGTAMSRIPGTLWGKLFKRKLLKDNISYIDESLCMGEDQVWLWPTLLQAEGIVFLKDRLYNYRKTDMQATRTYHANLWNMYRRVILSLRKSERAKRNLTGFDFDYQISLMALQFGINAIDNEFHKGCLSIPRAYKLIKTVGYDLDSLLGKIDYKPFGRRKIWLKLLSRHKWLEILLLKAIRMYCRRYVQA